MKDIILLFRLTFQEKKRLILSFVFTIFVAFFTFVFVNLVQPIMDKLLKLGPAEPIEKVRFLDTISRHVSDEQLMRFIPILVVVVIFGKGLFTFLSSYLMKSIGLKVSKKLRDDLSEHILRQSSDYFDRMATGELMSRLTNDVDKIQEAVSGSMGDFIQETFVLFALLIGIFLVDWHLALAAFIITPLAVIPLAIFSRELKKKGRINQVRMADIYKLLHETITGNKIVKAFTMEKFELKKFFQATMNYLKTSMKLAWIGSLSSPFMEFLGGVVGAFILIVGTTRITRGYISPGDFGTFVMAIFYMYTPIKKLSRANITIQQGVACYERIDEILKSKPQIVDHPRAYPLPPVQGHVKFQNVSFSYNENIDVLHGADFEILPKERVALIGLSGAGKTTIVNLLSRFYEPTTGRILIDGIDIREVTLSSLRTQIGLVTQELILFNDTARNNIAYGLQDIPMEKIINAAKAAKAHDFIKDLPHGYETQIGEKGGLLSIGQRQRITLARALLKNPPVLILDEATSALDSESERLIQVALANVMKDRTTFVIAHRLSTIRNADKILVLDKGRIAEIGTHKELYKKNGIYRKLYDLQFPEEKESLN
ncbi:MAG: ABC transporter ATP-binding protein/permease [Candidatus Aminicenantes bacterium]|nr:ABC transporter ATP-binding protein/permease [Candidatus Aminicenantes bacterium]MDH5742665.1 ABC transporter ATP-binding protein/permease [Candidatus Aminicenantes bacterium]